MSNQTGSDDAPLRARKDDKSDGLTHAGRSVTINRPRAVLFAFWSDFRNLPRFMPSVLSVTDAGNGQSAWAIKGPAGSEIAIRTEPADIEENATIGWRSVEGSDIRTEGRVTFSDAPGNRGTIVTCDIAYHPPGGDLGRGVAKLLGTEPDVQARHELKRFKMLMETGEIATAQPRRDEE